MEHLREAYEQMTDVCSARLSRRSFVKAGGALVVGFGIFRGRSAKAAVLADAEIHLRSLSARVRAPIAMSGFDSRRGHSSC